MSKRQKRPTEIASERGLWDSGLFKLGAKLLLSLIVMVLALTMMQCTVKKPESPTWNTQLIVPLINRTYSMSEIIEKMDQEGVRLDSDSGVIFTVTEEIDTIMLDSDELTTADLAYQALQQLGTIDIPAPVIAPVVLDIDMIGGLATYLPGMVPATSFSIVNSLPVISSFTSVGVTSGQAYVGVANNLGFEITADSVELWDVTYNRSIGQQSFPSQIVSGGVDSILYDLSGQTISNTIEARITASTPGGLVLSTSGKNLTTTVRFDGALTAGAATAEIPALSRDLSQAVTLGENDAVYRATLTSGSLQLAIANQTNLTADLDITLPDMVLTGTPLNIQRTLSPISSQSVAVDLTGYELTPIDSTVPQDVRIDVTASVAGTAPQQVTVSQSDQFMVDAGLSNLVFGTVTGVFSTVGTTLEPTQHEIDVPQGLDSAQLVSAILTLSIENAIELPGDLNLTLQGNNGKSLVIAGAISAGTVESATTTVLVDSTVADFLSPVPSIITLSGSAGFGDGVSESTIRTGDYIWASIDILAPLEIIIPETTVEPDIEREKIDQDDIDAITDHVIEARLLYNVINHMPLGATVDLFLGSDSATLISDPEVSFVNEIFVVAAPTVGSVVSDTVSTGYQEVVIDSSDLHVLENDTLYIGSRIVLDDTNGQPVKLTADDYLTIIGRIEVDYRFDGDF